MGELELKSPKHLKDLRVKHLAALTDPLFMKNGVNPDASTLISFLSKFFGIAPELLYDKSEKQMYKIYMHCAGLFGQYKDGKPKKEITIKGKVYELVDTDRPSVGWSKDVSEIDFEKDPLMLVCVAYIPKGTKYGEHDPDTKNLLYPIKDRYDDFKEDYPLDEYLRLNAFFLRRYERLMSESILKRKVENWTVNKLKPLLSKLSKNGSYKSTT